MPTESINKLAHLSNTGQFRAADLPPLHPNLAWPFFLKVLSAQTCISLPHIAGVPTTLEPLLLQKHRDASGRRIVIQIGGVKTTFCEEEGILAQKYRDRNGWCIAILFKSIDVRGRFHSPDHIDHMRINFELGCPNRFEIAIALHNQIASDLKSQSALQNCSRIASKSAENERRDLKSLRFQLRYSGLDMKSPEIWASKILDPHPQPQIFLSRFCAVGAQVPIGNSAGKPNLHTTAV